MQDLGARFMWRRETTGSSNWILPTAPPTQGVICDGIIKGGNTGGPSLFLSVKVWSRSHVHNFLNNPWGTCWAETYMFCSVFPIICTCLPLCSWESLYAEVESTDSSAYCQGSRLSSFQLWALGSNFSGPHWAPLHHFWSRSDDSACLTGQPRATVSLAVTCLEEPWLTAHVLWVFRLGPLCLLSSSLSPVSCLPGLICAFPRHSQHILVGSTAYAIPWVERE